MYSHMYACIIIYDGYNMFAVLKLPYTISLEEIKISATRFYVNFAALRTLFLRAAAVVKANSHSIK